MSLTRYITIVLAVFGASLAVLSLAAPEHLRVASTGGLLAVGNTIAAYALVVWSEGRSNVVFVRAVLGGMLGRLGLLLGAVVLATVVAGLPRAPFTAALLGYFITFLAFEMAVLQQRRPARVTA